MKRFILLCLLATLFVACTPSTDPDQQASDPTDSAPVVAESPTDEPVADEATDDSVDAEDTDETAVDAEDTDETVVDAEDTDETVVDTDDSEGGKAFLPALTPAEAGEMRDTDFMKGNPDAAVTIIEYGDFQ